MNYIVTGGAGFIGSCVVRTLNDMGYNNIFVVDNISSTDKWKNLVNKKYTAYFHRDDFFEKLPDLENIAGIIHMGACSSTTETNFDYLYKNNLEYTKKLWNYCVEKQISFIYASSAATYGDGALGFHDQINLSSLRPLNGYGYSKHLFDLWIEKQTDFPKQYVGLKFFNVYGPNEYFKKEMASVVFHSYKQIKQDGKIKLFKSYLKEYQDGGQLRDFVYVKDVCKVIRWFLEHPSRNGIYNVGTGKAQSFQELAGAVFKALDKPCKIEYIDMPENLRAKYQYFTEADIRKLRSVGYTDEFLCLEEGVRDYVRNYLEKNDAIY